jgi:hypothetical protein
MVTEIISVTGNLHKLKILEDNLIKFDIRILTMVG